MQIVFVVLALLSLLVFLASSSELLVAKGVEGVLAGADHIGCGTTSIVYVREFTALEAESFWRCLDTLVVTVREVRILDVLREVSDQELTSMTILGRA